MWNMKGRQSSITHITMAAGSLSPALDERAAMKKSDLSVLTRPEMNEALAVWSSATMTCLLSFTAPGASYFLPFALLQWRYAFIKGKRSKSSLAPKLKVGMPQLIRLNTFGLQWAGLLVCMSVLMCKFALFLNVAFNVVGQPRLLCNPDVITQKCSTLYRLWLTRSHQPSSKSDSCIHNIVNF